MNGPTPIMSIMFSAVALPSPTPRTSCGATGGALGSEAVKLGLVDEIATGDEYLFRRRESARLFAVSLRENRGWMRLLGRAEARVRDVMARMGMGRL